MKPDPRCPECQGTGIDPAGWGGPCICTTTPMPLLDRLLLLLCVVAACGGVAILVALK